MEQLRVILLHVERGVPLGGIGRADGRPEGRSRRPVPGGRDAKRQSSTHIGLGRGEVSPLGAEEVADRAGVGLDDVEPGGAGHLLARTECLYHPCEKTGVSDARIGPNNSRTQKCVRVATPYGA